MEDGGYHSSSGTNIRANGSSDGLNINNYDSSFGVVPSIYL